MEKEYPSTGAIGLCSYAVTVLIVLVNNKIAGKWLWQGEDMLQWACLFLAILAHIIIAISFCRMLNHRNWNTEKLLRFFDWLFFVGTILYIFLWILLCFVIYAFSFTSTSY
jgi:fatty-acid desaturase